MMKQGSKTKYDPEKHHRKSIRLHRYDYSQTGAYFVTIVTYQRKCIFGEIVKGEMVLNDFGRIARECWRDIPVHFDHVNLGAYVIMPNHVHGIVIINTDVVGAQHAAPCAPTRATIITKCHTWVPRCNSPILQIRGDQTNQCIAKHTRRKMLATKLLRTHHPGRTRNGCYLALYRI
jgi:REP element-mobilizing transposase RayT